jgi:hypothetical protein
LRKLLFFSLSSTASSGLELGFALALASARAIEYICRYPLELRLIFGYMLKVP